MSDIRPTPSAADDPENPAVPEAPAHADLDPEAVVDELDVDQEAIVDELDPEETLDVFVEDDEDDEQL